MEMHNLDFEVEMSEAQWENMARSAETLGPEGGGYGLEKDGRIEGETEIRVFMRPDDTPSGWEDWVSEPDTYGADTREAARFYFNSGRPYAEIEIGESVVEPIETEEEVIEMQRELESWVRGKWHELLRESGIHYDPGHTAI